MNTLNKDLQDAILKGNGRSANDNSDIDVSLNDIDSFGDKESIAEMFDNIKQYNRMLQERITFINQDLSKLIPFTRENLYLMCAYTGNGKCFQKGQGIMMHDGSIKKVEDVVVGDLLMGPDSRSRAVLSLARGREQMYDIIPKKGDKYTVNESHILSLKYSSNTKAYTEYDNGDTINISVKNYMQKSEYFKHVTKGYRTGVNFKSKKVGLDPYYLGLWLGDGCSEGPSVTNVDSEVINFLYKYLDVINEMSETTHFIRKSDIEYHYSIGNKQAGRSLNIVRNQLKELNVIKNKHIPDLYKKNSREVRLQILAGLVDSDGGGKDSLDFTFKNKQLANDIVYLCRSLGLAAYIHEVEKCCTNSPIQAVNMYHRISVSGDLSVIPTKIKRKQYPMRKQIKNVLHTGIKVVPTKIDNYYGFAVDGDHLFLLEDFTVAHNSTIAANISYPLWQQGKKVLVIANEESKSDVLYRIACLHLGYNFNAWKKGQMPAPKQKECVKLFPEISKYVKVLDVVYKDGLTTKLEGIINALEAVQSADFSCCLIDYYQLIINSVDDPSKGRYDVLNKLKIYLQRYIKKSNIPIVLFAQLHSMGKRANVELDSRVKECPAILEAATVVVECIPNFDLKKTDFLIKKDRFGLQGSKIECGFEDGKFVNYDDGFKNKVKQAQVDQLANSIEAQQRDNPYDKAIAEQHSKVDKLMETEDDRHKEMENTGPEVEPTSEDTKQEDAVVGTTPIGPTT